MDSHRIFRRRNLVEIEALSKPAKSWRRKSIGKATKFFGEGKITKFSTKPNFEKYGKITNFANFGDKFVSTNGGQIPVVLRKSSVFIIKVHNAFRIRIHDEFYGCSGAATLGC